MLALSNGCSYQDFSDKSCGFTYVPFYGAGRSADDLSSWYNGTFSHSLQAYEGQEIPVIFKVHHAVAGDDSGLIVLLKIKTPEREHKYRFEFEGDFGAYDQTNKTYAQLMAHKFYRDCGLPKEIVDKSIQVKSANIMVGQGAKHIGLIRQTRFCRTCHINTMSKSCPTCGVQTLAGMFQPSGTTDTTVGNGVIHTYSFYRALTFSLPCLALNILEQGESSSLLTIQDCISSFVAMMTSLHSQAGQKLKMKCVEHLSFLKGYFLRPDDSHLETKEFYWSPTPALLLKLNGKKDPVLLHRNHLRQEGVVSNGEEFKRQCAQYHVATIAMGLRGFSLSGLHRTIIEHLINLSPVRAVIPKERKGVALGSEVVTLSDSLWNEKYQGWSDFVEQLCSITSLPCQFTHTTWLHLASEYSESFPDISL
jgi:hypothetical protein